MYTQKNTKKNKKTEASEVIKLLEKIEKSEKLSKIGEAKSPIFIPQSSPTQGSAEVKLPLTYRQLPRIQ